MACLLHSLYNLSWLNPPVILLAMPLLIVIAILIDGVVQRWQTLSPLVVLDVPAARRGRVGLYMTIVSISERSAPSPACSSMWFMAGARSSPHA